MGNGRGRRRGSALVLVLVVAVVAVVAVVVLGRRGGAQHGSTTAENSIDMHQAVGENCAEPTPPGPGHPRVVLSQLFRVNDGHTQYLLGWDIVPYKPTVPTYHLGSTGNILALEPGAGGKPVGFGEGTLTFTGGTNSGTIDAVITRTAGGTIKVAGAWNCSSG